MTPALRAAGRRRYVSLTTFRRSGEGVSTAVWVAPHGDGLVVMTGGSTGKAKRLRREPRVELRECSMRGRVRDGAPVVHGRVELVTGEAEQQPLLGALHAKYGVQFRLAALVERVLGVDRPPERLLLRIHDA